MKKILLIGIPILGAGFYAYYYYSKQADMLMDLTYEPMGLKIDKLSLADQSILTLTLKISSKAALEAAIKSLNLNILLNGVKIGLVQEAKTIIIPAKGYSVVDLKITVFADQIRGNILSLWNDIYANQDAKLTIQGSAKVKSAFVTIGVPIDYTSGIKEMLAP